MEYPQVKVTDISKLLGDHLPLDKKFESGSAWLDDRIYPILARIRESGSHAYLLRWEGDKIPRGAVVGKETLAWTQNGHVNNTLGQMVGRYERVVECGGKSGRDQVMIVYMGE